MVVVALGPGKFYGSSLPRPCIYTDVKLNERRVDPPASVTDPLLKWAHEAHWSMGGLSFKRIHLQGRIEGDVKKLRKYREKQADARVGSGPESWNPKHVVNDKMDVVEGEIYDGSGSPPLAPLLTRKRKLMDLVAVQREHVPEIIGKKKLARRLIGDFDEIAKRSEALDNRKGEANNNVKVDAITRSAGVAETFVVDAVTKVTRRMRHVSVGRTNINKSDSTGSDTVLRSSSRLALRKQL